MEKILTSEELYRYLNEFRSTLKDFDYSGIGNIRFMNLESVYAYMENEENNPFKAHYNKLQKTLDILQPYLPFLSSERAKDFLVEIAKVETDPEVDDLKEKYTQKLRMDFITTTNKITCNEDWKLLIEVCEKIRFRKEESYLH